MKKLAFIGVLLSIASLGFAQPLSPLTSFPPGNYLSEGSYLADDGTGGCYASLIELNASGWNVAQFRNGALYYYENVLNIDANGFFSAQVTDASDPSNPVTYTGSGNCGSTQCQMTVPVNNGTMQKSIVFDFANNTIFSFGAIYYTNGTPNIQWEQSSALAP